jgi:hypothetical protein
MLKDFPELATPTTDGKPIAPKIAEEKVAAAAP